MPADNTCLIYSSSEKRTVIYKSYYEEDVVIVKQRKEGMQWVTRDHIMLPRNVLSIAVDFASAVTATSFIDLDSETPIYVYVPHATLSEDLRILMYKYDVESAPFCENQLGLVEQTETLLHFWDLENLNFSPLSPVRHREATEDTEEFKKLEDAAETPKNRNSPEAIETPKNSITTESDDDGTPKPSKCLAPKKRRITREAIDGKESKLWKD